MSEMALSDLSDDLKEERLMRLSEVLSLTGLSRSVLYREVNAGRFPQPLRIATRCVAWKASELSAWLDGLKTPSESEGA